MDELIWQIILLWSVEYDTLECVCTYTNAAVVDVDACLYVHSARRPCVCGPTQLYEYVL